MIPEQLALYPYWAAILLMLTGLYGIISQQNLIRQLIGLNILQVSVFVLYISLAYVQGGAVPIIAEAVPSQEYVSPLPHVLILTAIVVGIATTAVGLALAVRIHGSYGSLDEDQLKPQS